MNVIAKAIEDFEAGKIQVLFLNSRELGVGMNLITATDVILYHALTPEEEKQVVGRALRMGRTAPLHVHKLHHEGEMPERN
jgi:SNF2 family DNA or RNA helicase